jgi:uncharacterized protein YndB with AHSA1/START domain
MKILKGVVIGLGALIALMLIIAIFLPSHMRIERSTVIARPVETVYPLVADLKYWEQWNPWLETDPGATSSVTSPSTGVGAKWSWKGENVGTGSMTIDALRENERVDMTLAFVEPWEDQAKSGLTFASAAEGTTVTWWFEQDLSWPLSRWFGLLMDDMLGRDFAHGLEKLKGVAEK